MWYKYFVEVQGYTIKLPCYTRIANQQFCWLDMGKFQLASSYCAHWDSQGQELQRYDGTMYPVVTINFLRWRTPRPHPVFVILLDYISICSRTFCLLLSSPCPCNACLEWCLPLILQSASSYLPNTNLLRMLKSASSNRISCSLLTKTAPAIFSNITVKPRLHRLGAQPVIVIRFTCLARKLLISSDSTNTL